MSGTQAEVATRALVAQSPIVLVTRVEESSNAANTDCAIQFFLRQMSDCIVCQHRFRRN